MEQVETDFYNFLEKSLLTLLWKIKKKLICHIFWPHCLKFLKIK